MGLSHPAIDTRDVALFLPFRRSLRVRANQLIPLANLVTQMLGRNIGLHGEHPVSRLFPILNEDCGLFRILLVV
jgi:RNA exonuclease 4